MSNITYLQLATGTWAYRCDFQEGCTKHAVGWQVRANMHETQPVPYKRRCWPNGPLPV